MRSRPGAVPHVRPLHLAVERYVRCPRGGLVRVERCAACDLMQGTLIENGPQILCAYPEAVPAIRQRPEGSTPDLAGPPSPVDLRAPSARAAVPVDPGPPDAGQPTEIVTVRTTTLIFEDDWPDE